MFWVFLVFYAFCNSRARVGFGGVGLGSWLGSLRQDKRPIDQPRRESTDPSRPRNRRRGGRGLRGRVFAGRNASSRGGRSRSRSLAVVGRCLGRGTRDRSRDAPALASCSLCPFGAFLRRGFALRVVLPRRPLWFLGGCLEICVEIRGMRCST